MPLTGYRLVHVAAYTYRRKFTVKDTPTPKRKKKAAGYNFAVPGTGKRVTYV